MQIAAAINEEQKRNRASGGYTGPGSSSGSSHQSDSQRIAALEKQVAALLALVPAAAAPAPKKH